MTKFEDIQLDAPIVLPGGLVIDYRYSVGKAGTKFLRALGEKRILAVKCTVCKRIYVPPQSICPTCYKEMNEWLELEGRGAIVTYTIYNRSLPIQPIKPPFALGVIKLDGADTGITHFIGDVDFEDLRFGMRVEPVFRDKPQGNILDIKHFRPVC